ncbi:TPA: hypothetical protein R5B02_001602 [Campylobacter jejuni]|nr:hypothetical protein [Campylobacter jejuni]
MKLTDFDFRVCDNGKYHYPIKIDNDILDINLNIGINDEIELWTGFYDKNGNKIYENDILENKNLEEIYYITRDDANKMFKITIYEKESNGKLYKRKVEPSISFLRSFESEKNMEVIGNIRENKDLLK